MDYKTTIPQKINNIQDVINNIGSAFKSWFTVTPQKPQVTVPEKPQIQTTPTLDFGLKQQYPYISDDQSKAYNDLFSTKLTKGSLETNFPIIAKPSDMLKQSVSSDLASKAKDITEGVNIKPKLQITEQAKNKFKEVSRPSWLTGYRGELASEKTWEDRLGQIEQYNKAIDTQVEAIKSYVDSLTKPETAEAIASAINSTFVWDTAKEINRRTGADVKDVYNRLNESISQSKEFLTQIQNTMKTIFEFDIDMLGWMKEYGVK